MPSPPTEEVSFVFHQIKFADGPSDDGRFFHGMIARVSQGRDQSDDGWSAAVPADTTDSSSSGAHLLYQDVLVF